MRCPACNHEFTTADDQLQLERERLRARLAEIKEWPGLCNGDTDLPERHASLCAYHRHITDLERQLAEGSKK